MPSRTRLCGTACYVSANCPSDVVLCLREVAPTHSGVQASGDWLVLAASRANLFVVSAYARSEPTLVVMLEIIYKIGRGQSWTVVWSYLQQWLSDKGCTVHIRPLGRALPDCNNCCLVTARIGGGC